MVKPYIKSLYRRMIKSEQHWLIVHSHIVPLAEHRENHFPHGRDTNPNVFGFWLFACQATEAHCPPSKAQWSATLRKVLG